jgi:PAS domain S-box-containing protein
MEKIISSPRLGQARTSEPDRTDVADQLWCHSPDVLCVLDSQGMLRMVNPACTQWLGWLPEEIIGCHYAAFVHPDDRPPGDDAWPAVTVEPARARHSRALHKDGSYRWFSWVSSVNGEFIYASGRHITAEKLAAEARARADAALRQAQKMEVIGQLSGGIAHDFNNLLQALSSGLEVIGRRHIQSDDGRRLIRQACGVVERGAALTTQLLAFARKQQLASRVIDLNATLFASADALARKVGGDTPIIWRQDGPVWPALADPRQLEVAVLNLLLNAREAMPAGGTVTVATHNVAAGQAVADALAPGDYVALSVTDTGVGMTDDVRARACEPFFTTKGVGSGAGLGLSQVHGFAGQSGGTVRIVSTPGCGTTVEILLPRGQAADQGPGVFGGPQARGASQTVLVVDDDPDVRETTVAGLEDFGYRVLEAGSGAQCLRLLEREQVDLLVVDFAMPSMNGAELVHITRRSHPGMKVLFMTGYADLDVLRSYAEPHEILRKPFRLAALIEQVDAAMRR